jgi:hypothetical protein
VDVALKLWHVETCKMLPHRSPVYVNYIAFFSGMQGPDWAKKQVVTRVLMSHGSE